MRQAPCGYPAVVSAVIVEPGNHKGCRYIDDGRFEERFMRPVLNVDEQIANVAGQEDRWVM
jgi:hypothetical protein